MTGKSFRWPPRTAASTCGCSWAADEKLKRPGKLIGGPRVYQGKVLEPEDKDFISDDNLFNLTAQTIKKLAETQSCVIIGRCADFVLKDYPNVVSVFVHAPEEFCLEQAMERNSMTPKEMKKIHRTDRQVQRRLL